METTLIVLHVIGACLVLGVVVVAALIVFKKEFGPASLAVLRQFRWLGPVGSAAQFITGAALYWQNRDTLSHSTTFWIKIGLYVAEGLLASLVIDAKLKRTQAPDQVAAVRRMRWLYALHVVLILAIVVLGVVVAETQ